MMYDYNTLERMTFINQILCYIILTIFVCLVMYSIAVVLFFIYSIYKKVRFKEKINYKEILKSPLTGTADFLVACLRFIF